MGRPAGLVGVVLLLGAACGSGGSSSGACANLACLQQVQNLMLGCVASASCVAQEDSSTTPPTTTSCYDNGVKIVSSQETVTSPSFRSLMTYKVKKGDALCYTRTFDIVADAADAGAGFTTDIATQDPTGTTLVTTRLDADNVATVTCPGGQPTVFVDSCGVSTLVVSGAYLVQSTATTLPICTDGTCSF